MDIKIKQVWKFNSLDSVITDDVMCNTEIQWCIRIVKDAFQVLSKVLSDKKMSIEIKKRTVM